MGEKDITEKEFLSCADVAADAINVLRFQGQRMVCGDMLAPAFTETFYGERPGTVRNQLEDVAVYDMREGRIRALYLLSNQTTVDARMPFRKAGYVGGAYRMQYKNPDGQRYPVVYMVLYWGKKRWKGRKCFREYFADRDMPEPFWKAVDDWKVHVVEMRHLPRRMREQLTSDLRIVAEYLANPREMVKLRKPIEHPRELLNFLHALSGDSGYLELAEMLNEIDQTVQGKRGEKKTMCELLDMYRVGEGWDRVREMEKEMARERKAKEQEYEARKKEHAQALRSNIATCKKFNASFETTVDILKENFGLDDEAARQQVELYW